MGRLSRRENVRGYLTALDIDPGKGSARKGLITASTKFSKLKGKKKTAKDLYRAAKSVHESYAEEAVALLQEEIRNQGAVSTGDLVNDAEVIHSSEKEDKFSSKIGFKTHDTRTVNSIDQGRSPGVPPPLDEIMRWTDRHPGHNPYALRAKIAHEGTEGKFFMDRARTRIQNFMKRKYDRMLRDLLK